jgi:hypothetical protein
LKDRDQWQAEITDSEQHAMQDRLVRCDAGEDRGAVGMVAQAGYPQPLGPVRVEMAAQANLVCGF